MQQYKMFAMDHHDQQEQSDGEIKIGPFVFTKFISPKLKERLFFLYRNFRPRVEALRLQNGRLQELIPIQALELAEMYQIETLLNFDVTNNKLTSCNFLQKLNFPRLQILKLERNNIYNLTDIVNSIHFQQLEELILSNNHIISLHGLRRWSFRFLSKLQMELNIINDIRQITQANLPSLCILELQLNNIADFRHLLRSNFPKLQRLQIYDNTYNCDPKITYFQLLQRFPHLQVGSLPT